MAKTKTVRIEDVGPVTKFEFTLSPGVTVLQGAMGAGKSRTAAATARLFGADVPVEPRDGADHGIIETEGVRLVIRKVVRATGKADVELGDVGALAALIDPLVKDSEAAANARLRALAKLVRPPVTDEAVAVLAGEDSEVCSRATEAIHETGIQDLFRAAERVRLEAHGLKRKAEQAGEQAAGEASTLDAQAETALKALDGRAPSPVPVAEAEAAERRATEEHARAELLARQRAQHEARQAEVRASLGDRPDASAPAQAVTDAEAWLATRKAALGQLEEELRALTAKVADARGAVREAEGRLAAARDARESTAEAIGRWERQAAILDQAVEGPTPEEVDALALTAQEAREATALSRLSAAYLTNHEKAAAAHQRAAEAMGRAAALEALATSVSDRLGTLLASTPAKGLTVVNGRIHAIGPDGRLQDFERRLSEGQRARAAFRVYAAVSPNMVAPLDPRVWASFDDETKLEVAKVAVEEGMYVLTEQSTHGELTAAHLPS